ncbi:peptidoglycan/LPS O-acetylase OafA/YrhL [Leifsonia sp. AK011]|uniref:acyltransferase family protein n=1 Tax=Leifsonia sp. AK011 TaxID=2723075 RepID=UPI0015CA2F62|nr:acyltransferase [Leifsonia sp. AK011]NYF11666.1 peptidoglycan/LPS O-acetylase OafA/YrhL [Leifsonia sp. AK011]
MSDVFRATAQPRSLSPAARAGLDVARASAALYVVAHHVVNVPGPIGVVFSFGQEAVLVFFLLSGFVIFANEKSRVSSPAGYFLRRLRRIYPPIVLAMLVSLALWALGYIASEPTWESAVGTLASLQDISFLKPGVIVDPFLGNDPLWSLSYEVFFYAIFPAVMIAWRRSERATRMAVPGLAVLAYVTYLLAPNHFSLVGAYFLVWWLGAMLANAYLNDTLSMKSLAPELLGQGVLVAAALAGVALYGYNGLGFFPFLMVRHFVIALVLTAVLLVPTIRSGLSRMCMRIAGPGAAVASISYGIYVMHYPLMVQTRPTGLGIVGATILTILLAWVADKGLARILPKAPKG